MKVLIASDKFKGSLTSKEVAEAVAAGIVAAKPDCEVRKLFVADGGDGTAEAVTESLGGVRVALSAHNPCNKIVGAWFGIINGDTAVLDVATASGLSLLSQNERNPANTTSFGTGEIIRYAIENHNIRKFVIGVGGSATNDAAMGLLSALGYKFLDKSGAELSPVGKNLARVCAIDDLSVSDEVRTCSFTVLCDVAADFYGEKGAAFLFAPQKGASPDLVEELDAGMRSFAEVLKNYAGKDVRNLAYAGAAGGIAGTLAAVLGAELRQGVDAVLDIIDFDKALDGVDLVITGEGKIDRTSLLGKTPVGVCRRASYKGVPTIALAGTIADKEVLNGSGFKDIVAVTPEQMPLSEAMKKEVAAANISSAVRQIPFYN